MNAEQKLTVVVNVEKKTVNKRFKGKNFFCFASISIFFFLIKDRNMKDWKYILAKRMPNN